MREAARVGQAHKVKTSRDVEWFSTRKLATAHAPLYTWSKRKTERLFS